MTNLITAGTAEVRFERLRHFCPAFQALERLSQVQRFQLPVVSFSFKEKGEVYKGGKGATAIPTSLTVSALADTSKAT